MMRPFLSAYVIFYVLRVRRYATLFAVLSVGLTTLYVFLLPTLPFGAFVLQAVRFLTPIQGAFALVFGVLLALLITLNVYLHSLGGGSLGAAPAGSILASLVNALCCTPIVPTVLGLIGGFSPFVYGLSPRVEYFFEEYYWLFYILSVAILLYAVVRATGSVACCVPTAQVRGERDAN